jgi:WbqC-like protein family
MTLLIELQYFGTIDYYKNLYKSTDVKIESCEEYRKMSYRNRCFIAGANGIISLSIPVEGGRNQRTPIREVRISQGERWQLNHWRAIFSAYNRSPFFEYYRPELEALYQKRVSFLWDWNLEVFHWACAKLKWQKPIGFTQAYQEQYPPEIIDRRDIERPGKPANDFQPLVYPQVFEDRIGFHANLCILDLLSNEGPSAFQNHEKKGL